MSSLLKGRNIAFIGAGNMAEAMVSGLVRSGTCPAGQITVTDVRAERLAHFRNGFGVGTCASNTEALKGAAIVVLAIKPQVMDAVLAELTPGLEKNALVVSIAAGIRTARIENGLGGAARVARVMPNTPALVRAGVAAVCGGRHATEDDLRMVDAIMASVGEVVRVVEDDMDAVTALSGSGPAYVFYLIEAMTEAARQLGLKDSVAKTLIHSTVKGAAQLIIETGTEAAELRERVTSKGGTTPAALDVLNSKGVASAMVDAVKAAHRRSRELSGS